jgi:ribonucleoside-triphosphate reductase
MSNPEANQDVVSASANLTVKKRNGNIVPYDRARVYKAIFVCLTKNMFYAEATASETSEKITSQVDNLIALMTQPIDVEVIQNAVETQMMAAGLWAEVKQYILYRDEKRRQRELAAIPQEVVDSFELNNQYFAKDIQKFQALDKFAQFNHELGRREVWPETANRVMTYFKKHCSSRNYDIPDEVWDDLSDGLLNLKSSPSMRCVQMAGPALERCHVGVYNCAYQVLQSTTDFSEELYVLMQGTGVGFSVEREYAAEKFPRIKRQKKKTAPVTWVIEDTTEGWCLAYLSGFNAWLNGEDLVFDFSQIRPEGAPLKTKGGRSSGPGPLKELLNFTRNRILAKQGSFLTSLDLHDINCMAHRIVKMGGVRRASGISLSDLDDIEMRDCKSGEFWNKNNQRNQANNSAVYNEKPSIPVFIREWKALIDSNSGERGIFNRGSLPLQLPARRKTKGVLFGTNPCGEIILRSKQFCNLSIAVIRPDDDLDTIKHKVIQATIWGTLQSTMTDFKFISEEWKKNCEEERLLGVDLLGFLDHPLFQNNETAAPILAELKQLVIDTNKVWAEKLNINQSAATTCIKPSGDSSVFFDTAAGFKGHHGKYYVRRVRANATNPVALMLRDEGVPCHTDYDGSGLVLEFPMQAPETGILLENQTALSQLEQWKVFKTQWTEHNPSVTIYVRENEWFDVGMWVYTNWDIVGGLSFLPYDGGVYQLAPYEAISEAEYESRDKSFPAINWAKLVRYEKQDMTELNQQLACTGDACAL